jgi:methylmalonyl-CoA/ethylmalonyl-CoA epimerase
MILGIDHIGIAVTDVEKVLGVYRDVLGLPCTEVEEVASQKILSYHLRTGGSRIELLVPTDPSSTIARFLEKRGAGIHHIALEVDDLAADRARLVAGGLEPIGGPSMGANGKTIQFFHPRSTGGVLLEICSKGGGAAA